MTSLLYVQADGTLLVQSQHECYDEVRQQLLLFAQLRHRLDPIHVYEIHPMSLWQAASLGVTARRILECLRTYAAHPLPFGLQQLIVEETKKWGRLLLQSASRGKIVLRGDAELLSTVAAIDEVKKIAIEIREDGVTFSEKRRAEIKRCLMQLGFPVIDRAGYRKAPTVSIEFASTVSLRPYQREAVEQFLMQTGEQSGVIVLPCGSGKTIVGLAILCRLGYHALILTPNQSSAEQWIREIHTKTTIPKEFAKIYSPNEPLTPITVTTYQRVSAKNRAGNRKHLQNLTNYPWGIVIYDEVHMLPAPLFRLAADLQSSRRLGLTATLVREDGQEGDVFSLIGPKSFDIPWKTLEQSGYLAAVRCVEVRVELDTVDLQRYRLGTVREQHRIAALNRQKIQVLKQILKRHPQESVLVIGHYLESLDEVANQLQCPLITGKTPYDERELHLRSFREGRVRTLVLSRVANMAIDLPCASVAIQLSGLFGSRQEEAQRLGRLLRPGTSEGVFYTLVSRDTIEERMSQHRQMYLVEQGYHYQMSHAVDYDYDYERMNDDEVVGLSEHR